MRMKRGRASFASKKGGGAAMPSQSVRAVVDVKRRIRRRFRTRLIAQTAGIWMSVARIPIIGFEAPSWRAKATMKTPPVGETTACVAMPS